MNYNSGETGSGCVGRMGPLLAFATRKHFIVAKIDPITESLQRGPNGLCSIVNYFDTHCLKVVRRK